ncbi:aminotransferase class I/II-fold pyridoxal phosphate-dependent enzyme [Sphaerisporangium sp. B11E5]|uniref:aminotransferase class I/II-fold pyridoxal phosphate-dependent enzyme n=1 Tax=Sphaerisporangium sp. B11E5 TaxID=3153563 RepID=UPI00325E6423
MSDPIVVAEPVALSLGDYARLARERLDVEVVDYIEGGAGEERALAANTEAFARVRLRPSVLTGAGEPRLTTEILGRTWGAPIAVAPMGYQTVADPEGELATVLAAGEAGVPVVVSTFAGRTFEDLAAAAKAPLWLQLYCFRDRDATRRLVERAERAGFEAVVLTVDAPRLGRRLRDLRNGFRLPPGVEPANLEPAGTTGYARPAAHAAAEFDPALDWGVVAWLRSVTRLPVLLKGVLTAADAARAVEAGVDGLVVSNHGGRQLDAAPAALEALPEVVAAVDGACPVLMDGGVRRGSDVLAALALGAAAVLVGRPVLHGLAVHGQAGVRRVLDLLTEELADAMTLTGTPAVTAARPELVRPAPAPNPRSEPMSPAPGPRPRSEPTGPTAGPRPRSTGSALLLADLHSGVADPVMDTMNFLNEVTARYPGAVSFAPGRPYDGFFDVEQIFGHIRRYLGHLADQGESPARVRDAMFQYGPTAGRIRGVIADALRVDEGVEVPPESIVVTVGAQEAMFLVLRAVMSDPDDVLLLSTPCYVGITGAARLLDVDVVPVREREDGLSAVDAEAALRAELARGRRPRMLYVVPDHSNPSGVTMSLEGRRALLDLAARYDILIMEDSPYRLVSPGAQVPTLKSLDTGRRVVQLGSFSKTVFPGARVGYVVADQEVVTPDGRTGLLADELAKIKSMITVNTSPLGQAAVAGALLGSGGGVADLNRETAGHYGAAMRATLDRLAEAFPPEARDRLGVGWNTPSGGFFLTLRVGFPVDNAALIRSAEQYGVIWTPMSYFYPHGGGEQEIRLSISYLTAHDIDEGVARLARFVEAETTEPKR